MTTQNNVAQARRDGVLFGIPLGDLGWFQSLLMGLAAAFAAFFLATFLAIVGFMVYLMVTGKTPDFALTYRIVGLPGRAIRQAPRSQRSRRLAPSPST
jgi:hypothetical protein